MAWLLVLGGAGVATYMASLVSDAYDEISKPVKRMWQSYTQEQQLQSREGNRLQLMDTLHDHQSRRYTIAKKYSKRKPIQIINHHDSCQIIFINKLRTDHPNEAIEIARKDQTRWFKKHKVITLESQGVLDLHTVEIQDYHIIVLKDNHYKVLKMKEDVIL